MRRLITRNCIALAVLLTLSAMGYGVYRRHYPYGHTHRCDRVLYMGLCRYAHEHDGWFPRGAATPEESLMLLVKQFDEYAGTIVDKRIPDSEMKEIVGHREKLKPEVCGWHYVEGSREDDDHRLALFWDKAGLGHNGERLAGGGHIVCFVGCNFEHIPAARWEEFLEEQRRLRAALNRPTRDPLNPGPPLVPVRK